MAKKESDFMLGFVDEKIGQDDQSQLDYTSCKIGGKPDWISTIDRSPKCKMCNRIMPLVMQLYAPLDGALYHRTLYVFACITPECWNKSHSWICLRSQMLSKVDPRNEPKAPRRQIESTAMFEECDDWDDGNGNHDDVENESTPHLDIFATNTNRSINEPSRSNFNDRTYNNNSPVSHISNVAMQMNLNEENSNDNVCGAVAMPMPSDLSSEATALIEGSEDDIISIETPERPSSDLSSIFNAVTRIDTHREVSFVSFYIASDYENLEGYESRDHDQDLLIRYSHLEGVSSHAKSSNMFGEAGDAIYEKTSYNRNDLFFHKFSKRVHFNPSQVIRYCREEDASPLWLRPPVHETISRRCVSCGGRLTFEFQIMPQILNVLRVQGTAESPVLEFGTVVMFTCANSCWSDRSTAREEFVIVQDEVL